MTRRGTVIRHTILTSESVSLMEQDYKLVWIAMLLCADDWGRLPDKPSVIAMRCPAFGLSQDLVTRAIDYFTTVRLTERYTVRLPDDSRPVTVLQLTNWEIHQKRLTSRDNPECPNVDGNYEKTTNPLGLKALEDKEKESTKEKENEEKEKSKEKEKEKGRPVNRAVTVQSPDGISNGSVSGKNQKIITDAYQEKYIATYGQNPNWTSKDFKHCQGLLKDFKDSDVADAIKFMFENHDDLWSNNIGVFMSLTSTKLLQRAISTMRNPKAGKEKPKKPIIDSNPDKFKKEHGGW